MDADFLLIMKMKQGNDEAFEKFVHKYYGEILKYCHYRCFDMEYAEDLTQETFLRFFSNLSDYHYKGKTKNFLYTIAGNLCKNFYNKKKDIPTERAELEKQSVPSTDLLDFVLDRIMIETALKSLTEELQEVIILYYFQQLKISEIAGILNIGVPLVKYRLKQAKKHMEQFIGKEELYESGKNDEKL
ncbi:MAG: RNA polymerase sigma factor [Lachnospiraceae bacterium]|nr:RNA polymerase sigma factor [Lachnospiraceae bacterium]